MNQTLRNHADQIIREAVAAVQPDAAVQRALASMHFPGKVFLVAVGKAAWQMAKAASECLGSRIERGVVVTKYGHVLGPAASFDCYEAGHPIPDENSFRGTQAALDLVAGLTEKDTVLFLLSGGGSALFEKPLVSAEELRSITEQLLACGADITEINTIRKRLSAVKGGRFAQLCKPAHVEAVVLSDILGDPLDMIASGPACPDSATSEDAWRVQKKYKLKMSDAALKLLDVETPKLLGNVRTQINGSVRELCCAAAKACEKLGYVLASVLRTHSRDRKALAFIAGGETVVKLTGHGLGGRNQEIALSAAAGISGMCNAAVFSVGSDGTDGPTDAAGGYVDGDTCRELLKHGLSVEAVLQENDAYHALQLTGGLIMTGPTGTNVNDVAVALLGEKP